MRAAARPCSRERGGAKSNVGQWSRRRERVHAPEAEPSLASRRRWPIVAAARQRTRDRRPIVAPVQTRARARGGAKSSPPPRRRPIATIIGAEASAFLCRFSAVNFVLSPEGPLTGTGVTGTGCADFMYIPSLLPPQQTTVQQQPPAPSQPAPVAATPSMSRGEMCGNLTGNSFICTYQN